MQREWTLRRITTAVVSGFALVALSAFAAAPATADTSPSIRELNQIKTELDGLARTPGTVGLSWGVDADTKAVVVSVPKGDTDTATKSFVNRARSMDDDIRIQRVPGAPRLTVGPGDAILTGGSRCSASVIGTDGSTNYVVTAGHCTNIGTSWTDSSGAAIGNTAASSFPTDDYGLIQVTGSVALDNYGLTSVGQPAEGSAIEKVGSTTGTTSGTLVGYGRTVNYAEGTVYDMIETDACVQPGDSGGSLYQGSTAIGITSGGTVGSCGAGFQSFFQPVQEALDAGGLSLY